MIKFVMELTTPSHLSLFVNTVDEPFGYGWLL